MKKVKRFAEFIDTRDIPRPEEMIPVEDIDYSLPDLPTETDIECLQLTDEKLESKNPH